jgi:uncharacterized membrane protein YkvA (DUF1232 family)
MEAAMAQRRTNQFVGTTRVIAEPGLWDNLRLSWRLVQDNRVAPTIKLIVPIMALLYVLSPIDLIPDFLLGLGQIDDLGIIGGALLLALRLLPRLAPAPVLAEHQAALGLRSTMRGTDPGPRRTADQPIETSFRVHGDPAGGRPPERS